MSNPRGCEIFLYVFVNTPMMVVHVEVKLATFSKTGQQQDDKTNAEL